MLCIPSLTDEGHTPTILDHTIVCPRPIPYPRPIPPHTTPIRRGGLTRSPVASARAGSGRAHPALLSTLVAALVAAELTRRAKRRGPYPLALAKRTPHFLHHPRRNMKLLQGRLNIFIRHGVAKSPI